MDDADRIKSVFYGNEQLFRSHRNNFTFCFKQFFPCELELVFKLTQFLDCQNPTFRGRLHCILNDIHEIPVCTVCGKQLDIHDCRTYAKPKKHCSSVCTRKDPVEIQKLKDSVKNRTDEYRNKLRERKKNTYQRILEENPNYWKERDLKSKQTKLKRYGSENYMAFGSPEYQELMLARHGDRFYTNKEKCKATQLAKSDGMRKLESERRRMTFERHKAEDSTFVKKIAEKSKTTRLKNNGSDYTGRAKARKTCLEKYGVENPYQCQDVKDAIKKENLQKYGVEFYSQTDECKQKVQQTCTQRYGSTSYSASDEGKSKLRQHLMQKYGVESTFQRQDVKDNIAQTNLQRYGVSNPMQNPEIRKRGQLRYVYDGVKFDSGAEVIFYIWNIDKGNCVECHPRISFKYEFNGKTHIYQPDFIVDGQLIEIKGNHFFSDDGRMRNPYDHSQDGLYEAKHQCMKDNNVKIIMSSELDECKQHFIQKFGSLIHLKKFKNAVER